eukprot:UN02175
MGSWWFYPTENTSISTECNHDAAKVYATEPVPIDSTTKASTPNRSRMKLYLNNDVLNDITSCNNDEEYSYSASAASSGGGFHGETAILGKTFGDNSSLPSDANQIMDSIQNYLQNIKLDENVMNIQDSKFINNVWDSKLKDNLNDLVTDNKMSNFAYDTLTSILNKLQSNEYDSAKKKITQITKNTKEFKINKKWIVALKSIVRIAKKHNI